MQCNMRILLLAFIISNAVNAFQFTVSSATKKLLTRSLSSIIVSTGLVFNSNSPLSVANSAELPSLEKCFNAVRKELDTKDGESLIHIKTDIDLDKWDDLKLFTREYDAGFRGGVLKNAWKQLGDQKQKGISVTNSFTFDLIALNKAARNQDKVDAYHRLDQITQDLKDFLALEPAPKAQ